MKLSNPFKKEGKSTASSKLTRVDKGALKNVVGGGDPVPGLDVDPNGLKATVTVTGTVSKR